MVYHIMSEVLNYLSKMIIDKVFDTENNSSTVNKNIDKTVICFLY